MTLLNLTQPLAGVTRSTEEPKVNTDLTAIQAWANGQIDGVNINLGANNWIFTAEVAAPDLRVTGLGSATVGARFVGATNTGAPTSGAFQKGDFVVDLTGQFWICTAAGSPGSWTAVGGAGGGGGGSGATIPTGMVASFGMAAMPTGWLACDGSAVSRATFATLFGVLGTAWGPGDGTTTFNVPDLRGRGTVGAGTGPGLTNRVLGSNGGEESHLLSSSESALPSHTHSYSDPGHGHSASQGSHSHAPLGGGSFYTSVSSTGVLAAGSSFGFQLDGFTTGAAPTVTVFGNTVGITITNASANASSAHNNMPPYAALGYGIKT